MEFDGTEYNSKYFKVDELEENQIIEDKMYQKSIRNQIKQFLDREILKDIVKTCEEPDVEMTDNWFTSCDYCNNRGDNHYCNLHNKQIKNMNIKRCKDWELNI